MRHEELRCALAICAAAVGVLICLHQRHFQLSFAHPHSFITMTTHRCGLVLLAATAGAGLECVALLLPRPRRAA